ncbi:MAG: 23S ribosomal RNA methyltransferase Erm [Porphyromonadaceae bacterium]|jgi:23S rRNA (adenine-N6)-dimethyltransferase|nr:23S ribosomal RNA methyltransferase Erm [Porphyromonadaceae bacterium]
MKKYRLPVRVTGQHFTVNSLLIHGAIRLAEIQKKDLVLDIGAGRGFLTDHLAKFAGSVIAIENDPRLVAELKSKFKSNANVTVIGVDFRQFPIPKKPFKVVSNIPYGITSDILKTLMFHHVEYFAQGCLVMQLEPALKLIQRDFYNPYVVFYHTFYTLELMYKVSPSSFMPPPTVWSALLRISKNKGVNVSVETKEKYLDFLYFMLRFPDMPTRTVLKKIFRKQQVRELAKMYELNLDNPVRKMSAQQFSACFAEMLKLVPNKFHPKHN